LPIEVDVGPAVLSSLLGNVRAKWEQLGRTEPHWSVLSIPEFKAERIADTVDGFFGSGAADAALFRSAARRCNLELPQDGVCFELGCGVGRITIWLADSFRKVIGADISTAHLAVAEEAIERSGRTNIELRLIDRPEALQHLPTFDAFYSMIVLQHNPPPVMRWLLQTTLRKLKPAGLGFFQLPTIGGSYAFEAAAYLSQPSDAAVLEMHVLPEEIVLEVVEETGCELLEEREHDCIGNAAWLSKTFLVRKITA
jgi:cyclopropane fatty-acyl-phospholipid synthase-like methyltransferase